MDNIGRIAEKEEQLRPVVLDLFCGAGGMSLGFEMAGYEISLGVDLDQWACRTHAHNFGGRTAQIDITTIPDPAQFVASHGLASVHVIVGGPPCQGFSRVGRGKLRQVYNNPHYIHDPRNHLYREFSRFVSALRPLYFVMENVPDIQFYREGDDRLVDKAVQELEQSGYVVDWQVLLAADYGVPQMRYRFFMVGNRLGKQSVWPARVVQPDEYLDVWTAIGDLPVVGPNHRQDEIPYQPRCLLNQYQLLMRQGCDGVLYNHQTRWHNQDDLRAFRFLREGGRYIELPDELRRYDSKRHPDKRDEYFRDRYRKLVRSRPSWTLEAHIGKDTYRFIPDNA